MFQAVFILMMKCVCSMLEVKLILKTEKTATKGHTICAWLLRAIHCTVMLSFQQFLIRVDTVLETACFRSIFTCGPTG